MYQIDNPTAAAVRPASTAEGEPGWFTGGNPGSNTPATKVDAEWLNMLQAEFLGILEAAGLEPDKASSGQIAAAIQVLVGTLAASPSAGDSSLAAATTAFVNNLLSGRATVNVAGGANVNLTATQYGAGIITLTGEVTGNITVFFPASGRWLVINNTTGAYTVTCRTAGGTGYIVRQGAKYKLYGDGTNIMPEGSPTFSGTAAPPTLQLDEVYEQYT